MIPTPFHRLNISLDDISESIEQQRDHTAPHRDLEMEMMQYNGGIDLGVPMDRQFRKVGPSRETIVLYAPGTSSTNMHSTQQNTTKRYAPAIRPCSMAISSPEELIEVISVAYTVAHFTYIDNALNEPTFPHFACGSTSRSVVLSLMDFGYSNACIAQYETEKLANNHDYVTLPFVAMQAKRGVIIVDPTHEQLKSDICIGIYIRWGSDWNFIIQDRSSQRDFAPEKIKAFFDTKGDSQPTSVIYSTQDYCTAAFENVLSLPEQARPYVASTKEESKAVPRKARWKWW